VLIVDAQASPTASGVLVAVVRSLTDLPVRWVVNTHWHTDHVAGNQAWADAFPGVRFLGHEATPAAVLDAGRSYLDEERAGLPQTIAQRREWLASGTGPDGRPLTDDDRARVEHSLRLRTAYLADLATLRLMPPDSTFRTTLTLDLGGRTVELLHPGPAHTRGDVVAHLPDVGVLAAGDLLEDAAPWIDGADVPGWADALERLQALDVRVLLPAHGRVHRDRALLDAEARLFRAAVDGAARALAEGWSADEAAQRTDLDDHRPFLASVGVEGQAFETFRRALLTRTMEQLSDAGGWPAPGQ
jgi:glyoxylase-like metal-dependent hydrolase (beta-lactamase superfamily II)